MTIKQISDLVKERDRLLDIDSKDIKIDRISKRVENLFKKNCDSYPVDYIIETLTMFGQAPNIVYDDNGKFAISGGGYQPVVSGNQKIHGNIVVFTEPKMWKKTIRAALKYYLNN